MKARSPLTRPCWSIWAAAFCGRRRLAPAILCGRMPAIGPVGRSPEWALSRITTECLRIRDSRILSEGPPRAPHSWKYGCTSIQL